MIRILRDLPWLDRHETVTVRGESVRLRPYQIIVWVSVHLKGVAERETDVPRIPAILDTGSTFSFTLAEHHLVSWVGIHPESMPVVGAIAINNPALERRAANVWIHSNRKGKRHELVANAVHRLELPRGIAVYPQEAGVASVRLPLLGLRALHENNLDLRIDGRRRRVSLRTGSRLPIPW